MLLAASIACLSGCAGIQPSPLVNERRSVHLEQDKSKTIVVLHEMVWYDVPAGGYIDGDGSTRILVWKLGSDFMNREGKDWKKSF